MNWQRNLMLNEICELNELLGIWDYNSGVVRSRLKQIAETTDSERVRLAARYVAHPIIGRAGYLFWSFAMLADSVIRGDGFRELKRYKMMMRGIFDSF